MNTTTEALKALIKLSGLRQKDYATKHGIDYKQLNRWTNGHVCIPFEKLQKLAKADNLKINVEYSIINL
jgi:transcriptional regulator with XRE-family HTH domain